MLWEHRKRAPDKHWGGGREEEAWKGLPKEIIAEVSLVKPASLWRERGRECGYISMYSYHKDTEACVIKTHFGDKQVFSLAGARSQELRDW